MSILLFVPLGGSIMHGFSNPTFRWEFIILIFNIIVVLPFIENPKEINRFVLLISIIAVITTIILGSILFNIATDNLIPFDLDQIKIYGVYSIFYLLTFLIIFNIKKTELMKNMLLIQIGRAHV